MDRARQLIARCNTVVCAVFRALAAFLLATMTLVILLQVFCRYLLGDALPWPEELARYMMVWMTFLVAPAAYRANLNVRLDTLLVRLPRPIRIFTEIAIHLLILLLALVLIRESLWMIERGGFMRASSMDFPMARVYAIIPVGLAMVALVGVEHILRLLGGEEDRMDRGLGLVHTPDTEA